MLTNPNNPQGQEQGKNIITYAIIGFFLLFASFWILQILELIFGINVTGGTASGGGPTGGGTTTPATVVVDCSDTPCGCGSNPICNTTCTFPSGSNPSSGTCAPGGPPPALIPGSPPFGSNCPVTGANCSSCGAGQYCYGVAANVVACCQPVTPINSAPPAGSICTSGPNCSGCTNGRVCYRGTAGTGIDCCEP